MILGGQPAGVSRPHSQMLLPATTDALRRGGAGAAARIAAPRRRRSGRSEGFLTKPQAARAVSSSKKKKGAPLPASSAGLLRFFEDETKGFKVSPKIVITIPIGLVVGSWLMEIFLVP